MAVAAGRVAGYVVVETTAGNPLTFAHGTVFAERAVAVPYAQSRAREVGTIRTTDGGIVPLSTFKVFALVEVDEP